MTKEEKNTKVTRRLKDIREKQGISLRELATELDINYSAISYWERGRRYPGVENQEKLEKFFGEPIDFLMEEDPSYKEELVK